MKKKITGILVCFLIVGFSSIAGAYSYSFDFQGGGVSLHVAENCSLLSVITPDCQDIVVDLAFDLPTDGGILDYTASADMTLGLLGVINFDLQMVDLSLGRFPGIDPSIFLVDERTELRNFDLNDPDPAGDLISAEFGGYTLTDATFLYDVTITPDSVVEDRYSIDIDTLTLNGGNTSDLLAGLINELNGMEGAPISLSVPFTLPITLSGTVDIQADPVPVPAAVWLLGSGLLGLAGFRRRQT